MCGHLPYLLSFCFEVHYFVWMIACWKVSVKCWYRLTLTEHTILYLLFDNTFGFKLNVKYIWWFLLCQLDSEVIFVFREQARRKNIFVSFWQFITYYNSVKRLTEHGHPSLLLQTVLLKTCTRAYWLGFYGFKFWYVLMKSYQLV